MLYGSLLPLKPATVWKRGSDVPDGFPLRRVPLQRTALLEGPWQHHFRLTSDYLLSLENDAFLEAFYRAHPRPRMREPRPTVSWGGWVGPKHNWRKHDGEFQGHYLSACARAAVLGQDARFRDKSRSLIDALAEYQLPDGMIYVGRVNQEELAALFQGTPTSIPLYVIHKLLMGLHEQHLYLGDSLALDMAVKWTDSLARNVARMGREQISAMLEAEHGGIAEIIFEIAAVDQKEEHLELARKLLQASIIEPLARGEDILTGRHCNTTIPVLQGTARAYELTGERSYRDAVENFWRIVAETRSYATGGTSVREKWGEPNQLKSTLSASTQETCVSYNWLRLTEYLLRWTGEASYADAYERTLINGMLAAQHPVTGQFCYYMPMRPGPREPSPDAFDPDPPEGGSKHWGRPLRCFWCCYGTGSQFFTSPSAAVYYSNGENLWVSQFMASRVTAPIREELVTLEQRTSYPFEEGVRLLVTQGSALPFTISLRLPRWVRFDARITVNGIPPEGMTDMRPGSWVSLRRAWQAGDRIEIDLPMHVHTQAINDDPDCLAFLNGPQVLAGLISPELDVTARSSGQWLTRDPDDPSAFTLANQRIKFKPLCQVTDEEYRIYFDVEKGVRTDSVAIRNPRRIPVERLPAERVRVGSADDYKPCVAVLPTGELLLSAFRPDIPAGDRVREEIILFRSRDGGLKWSGPDKPELVGREPYLTVLRSGVALMTVHLLPQDTRNPAGYVQSFLHRSEDAGGTWTTQSIEIDGIPTGAETVSSRNVLELQDGSLLLAVSASGGLDRSRIWRSYDGGKSWPEKYQPVITGIRSDYPYTFFGEAVLWQAHSSRLFAIKRIDYRYAEPSSEEKPPADGYNDNYDRMVLYASDDCGRNWTRVRNLGGCGQMYPSLLRLGNRLVLMTYTVRALSYPLGVRATLGTEEDDGLTVDFEHDLIMLDVQTPYGKRSGGGFGPTVRLKDGTLLTSYSYRAADDRTRVEVVRWRLPEL